MALRIHQDCLPIPQEVINLIIDEACDDKPTLIACSLVSSAFIPGSRRHIFSTITFTCGQTAYPRYEQFHALSVSNHDLPAYIRELYIKDLCYDFDGPIDWNNEENTDTSMSILLPAILPAILKSLKNLRSLDLSSTGFLRWDLLDAQQQNMFLELIASVPLNSITIKGVEWPLSSFTQCRQLRDLTITHPKNDCDHRHKPDLALYGAQLKLINFDSDVDALSESFGVTFPSLQNFTVACKFLSDIAICQDIFESASNTLETLELSVRDTIVLEPFQTKLPALRHLSITFAQGTGIHAVRWLLPFLENLSAHLLEDLFLSVPGDIQTFNDALWSQTHALLTHQPTFPHLHYVKIYVIIDEETPDEWGGDHLEEESEAVKLLEHHLVSDSRVEFYFTSHSHEDALQMFEWYLQDNPNAFEFSEPTTPV